RLRLVHAAGHIVTGTVAGAEIATNPIRTQVSRSHLRAERRRATQVGAQTNQHQNFRLDRTHLGIDISRLVRSFGLRVRDTAFELDQVTKNFLGTINDEYGLTAP